MILRSILFTFVLLFFASCSDERTEIIDRWDNGAKKTVVTYIGTGSNEKMTVSKNYDKKEELLFQINHVENDTVLLPNKRPMEEEIPVGTYTVVKAETDSADVLRYSSSYSDWNSYQVYIENATIRKERENKDSSKYLSIVNLFNIEGAIIEVPKLNRTNDYYIYDFYYQIDDGNILITDKDYSYKTYTVDEYINELGSRLDFSLEDELLILKSYGEMYDTRLFLKEMK